MSERKKARADWSKQDINTLVKAVATLPKSHQSRPWVHIAENFFANRYDSAQVKSAAQRCGVKDEAMQSGGGGGGEEDYDDDDSPSNLEEQLSAQKLRKLHRRQSQTSS